MLLMLYCIQLNRVPLRSKCVRGPFNVAITCIFNLKREDSLQNVQLPLPPLDACNQGRVSIDAANQTGGFIFLQGLYSTTPSTAWFSPASLGLQPPLKSPPWALLERRPPYIESSIVAPAISISTKGQPRSKIYKQSPATLVPSS